jgi:hypothetical protein
MTTARAPKVALQRRRLRWANETITTPGPQRRRRLDRDHADGLPIISYSGDNGTPSCRTATTLLRRAE